MGLFDKFDNIYNTDMSASQVCNMKVGDKPYEQYDKDGKLIGYYWYYGDTIELDFEIYGEIMDGQEYIDASEYLKDKLVKIKIYNFRYETIFEREQPVEVVVEETTRDVSSNIKVIIDQETSKKLLRGTYYLTVTVFKNNYDSLYLPIVDDDKDCIITIK